LPGREALGHKDPDRLPNHALARLTYRNLELLGGPQWDPDAVKFCQELQQNLGLESMAQPILDEMIDLCPPEKGEAQLRALLPSWQLNYTSDDYVDWTWHTPTVRLIIGRCTLKPPAGCDYPSWSWNALGGYSSTIVPTIICAAKTIAATTLDLLTQPEQLEKARSEFNDRTGGGIHGTKWVPPLLPADFAPPTGFHWPEYVTTARGHEWYIPRWRLERKHHGRQMRSAGSCPLRQQMSHPWS
jgi:aminobenzoyl-glutamate utilization protein B